MLGIVAGAVLAAAVFAVLLTVPSDDYLILPDRARPTDQLVEVPGEQAGSGKAGIYMVDVTVGRANLFERIFHRWLFDGESLVPARVINPEGVSDTQRRQSSLNEMSQSQLIAITVALRSLGKTVEVRPEGAEVVLVQPGAPADGKLEVGDVIVEAEGQPVRTTDDLARAASALTPGDDLTLTVKRGDKRIELTLPTQASESDPERAVVGIGVQNAEDYNFPVDVKIDAGSIGGPSAGLAFALDVANELGTGPRPGAGHRRHGGADPRRQGAADRGRQAEGDRRRAGGRRPLPRPGRQRGGGAGGGRRPRDRPGLDLPGSGRRPRSAVVSSAANDCDEPCGISVFFVEATLNPVGAAP